MKTTADDDQLLPKGGPILAEHLHPYRLRNVWQLVSLAYLGDVRQRERRQPKREGSPKKKGGKVQDEDLGKANQGDAQEKHSFDALTRGLASDMLSRRQALKLVGGVVFSAVLGGIFLPGEAFARPEEGGEDPDVKKCVDKCVDDHCGKLKDNCKNPEAVRKGCHDACIVVPKPIQP